jgi:hypothetical protein
VELVAGAGETTKAHPLEAMLDLQVCKTHLYLFARITRSLELRRALQWTGMVARILIDVASNLLERCARASLLERASAALLLKIAKAGYVLPEVLPIAEIAVDTGETI